MVASGEQKPEQGRSKKWTGERASRILRDINAIGAVAIGGVALVAPPAAAIGLGIWAGINAAQAAGFEVARQHFAKRRKKKNEQDTTQ